MFNPTVETDGAAADADAGVEPRWLDDDERRAWINVCKVLLTLPGALESQLLRDADLTLFGYMILARLDHVPESTLGMTEIAEMANGSLSRASHAVARLEKRGWVTRTVRPGDGRRYTVATLTDDGRAHLRAAAPGHVERVRTLVLDPLGVDGVPEIGALCNRIVAELGLPTDPLY